MEKYKDIINLPHHESKTHPHMSLYDRAAQFSPFAALTGYESSIYEAGRITEEFNELSFNDLDDLEKKLNILNSNINKEPLIKVVYFVNDEKKSGGAYFTKEGILKRIDEVDSSLVFKDKEKIKLNCIKSIECELFNTFLDDMSQLD